MQNLSIWPDTPEKLERARARFDRFAGLSARCRDDASLRARLADGDAPDALSELGIELPPGFQAKIVSDTPETFHFVIPPDPNIELSDEVLNEVAGGKTAGSAGTALGCMGSVATSTGPSTMSTAGTAGTVGSVS